jgi:hypothetical protein
MFIPRLDAMAETVPNPELLRSLGRLVRGLSALFWGLPLALIVCVQTARTDWLQAFTIVPPLIGTGVLLFGLWQLGSFQRQERPWRNALDRARLLGLINFGLSPFLYWWNRVPDERMFFAAVCVLALSGLVFLFEVNYVLDRLGAMLPDEALRIETRQYTRVNRILLISLLLLVAGYFLILWIVDRQLQHQAMQMSASPGRAMAMLVNVTVRLFGLELSGISLAWAIVCLLVLLPLSMTMALIWKTKEVILDSVFGAKA